MKYIFSLRKEQKSNRKIQATLAQKGLVNPTTGKVLSKDSIERILKNRFYIGIIESGNIQHMAKHQPIIERKLFNLVQKINKEREQHHEKTHNVKLFPFKGLITCKICGTNLRAYKPKNKKQAYYECKTCSKATKDELYPEGKRTVTEEELASKIFEIMKRFAITQSLAETVASKINSARDNDSGKERKELKNLQARKKALETKSENLLDMFAENIIDELTYRRKLRENSIRISEIQQEILTLKSSIVTKNEVSARDIQDLTSSFTLLFSLAEDEEKRRIIELLIDDAKAVGGKVDFSINQVFKTKKHLQNFMKLKEGVNHDYK